MSKFLEVSAAALLALTLHGQSALAQDAVAGEKVFAKCKACHAVGEGAKNKVGPQLNGVMGRTAGTAEGYKYSPAMSKAGEEGLVWDDETLKTYLNNPKGLVKGTKMAFAGLKKDEDVANIIAYLHGFSSGGAAPPETDAPPEPGPDAANEAASPSEEIAAASPAPDAEAAPEPSRPDAGAVLGLGRAATADEIAAWDIDVRPDGTGLPKGRGTVAQGEPIYEANCAACHGDFGEAVGRWPVLAGGADTLTNDRPEKTIGSYWPYLSTVYDYVRRAMPFGNARSLSDDDVYALTAYLLFLNDVVTDEEFELSSDNFASIKLPNEPNFIPDDRAGEAHNAVKEPCMTDCVPGKAQIKMHAAVLDVTPEDSSNDEAPAAGIE